MTGKTWLLKWNTTLPERLPEDLARLEAIQTGAELEWPCVGEPEPGDRIYVLRLGKEQPGLLAAGTVTRGSMPGADWNYPVTKTNQFLRFHVDDVRHRCAEGFLPRLMLEKLLPGQRWSLIHDAGEVEASVAEPLEHLWSLARGRHALAACVDAMAERRGPRHRAWLASYQELVQKVAPVRSGEAPLTEELLAELWRAKNNGVTGVGSGALPGVEFEQNQALLEDFTVRVLQDPSGDTLQWVWRTWDEHQRSGGFSKRRPQVIHRVFAAIAPERCTSLLDSDHVHRLQVGLERHFELPSALSGNWAVRNAAVQALLQQAGLDPSRCVENNVAMWELFMWLEEKKPNAEGAAFMTEADDVESVPVSSDAPLNLILFGPPGTGKTFSTINETLRILEPGLLEDPMLLREDLVEAFEDYVSKGQVVFCTFHQSFSYEDFVEGLRANSQEGQLHYEVESGLFKRLCERASQGRTEAQDPFDQALACLRERAAANDGRLHLHTVKNKPFMVEYSGGDTFLVYPANTEKGGYTGNLKLVRQLYQTGIKDGIYNLSYVEGMLRYLQGECGLPPFQPPVAASAELEKFVLVIDEINRGNVSRIFGELITLIEDSKRAGKPEALSVVLPYSKERFSVPSNLYLIGTMNTADRSLAGLDVALRRRFTFREMPPRSDLLDGVLVGGVDIGELLRVINQRIEVLLGRDYCLGHAYFMELKQLGEDEAFVRLAVIFRQKVLPLLQEYFFEDWERIGWVLNDQHAASKSSQPFIRQPASEQGLVALFGSKVAEGLSDRRWELNDSAFDSLDSYRNILGNAG